MNEYFVIALKSNGSDRLEERDTFSLLRF